MRKILFPWLAVLVFTTACSSITNNPIVDCVQQAKDLKDRVASATSNVDELKKEYGASSQKYLDAVKEAQQLVDDLNSLAKQCGVSS